MLCFASQHRSTQPKLMSRSGWVRRNTSRPRMSLSGSESFPVPGRTLFLELKCKDTEGPGSAGMYLGSRGRSSHDDRPPTLVKTTYRSGLFRSVLLRHKYRRGSANIAVVMFTASGLLVRFLKVFEKSGYQSVKWVRYLSKANGSYQIRVRFLSLF
jgi:hypothetical protein